MSEVAAGTLEELRRLHEAGTPGPWEAAQNPVAGEGYVNLSNGDSFPGFNTPTLDYDDASLIAAMRNALPLLLDLADEVRLWADGAPRPAGVFRALKALEAQGE